MVKVNWSAVLQKCQPQARQKIIDLRSRHEDLLRQLSELRQALPAIDWASYRAQLGPDGVQQVDTLEHSVKQFRPTMQDVKPALLIIEQEKQEKLVEAKVYLENLETDIVTLKEYLARLDTLKDVDDITIDDMLRVRPDLAEQHDSELEKDNWGVAQEHAAKQ